VPVFSNWRFCQRLKDEGQSLGFVADQTLLINRSGTFELTANLFSYFVVSNSISGNVVTASQDRKVEAG